jgi:6-pyruvoyltetrahydropterin/6-carboxytetrahydropterin synthase
MRIRIAKEFNWEMSHRLPFHNGDCKNIHGHTYKVRIEIEGETDSNGILIDYYDLAKIVAPVIQPMDHAFLVDESDHIMLDFLRENNFKHVVVPFTTTAENIVSNLINKLKPRFQDHQNIDTLKIRFHETSDVFAELEIKIK